ncbi:unnamed protein product [Adineta steineri]|uniref:Transposase n=1 Tax=Adineta steineri TaxID=433720 RepID=A0A815V3G6_9BILA|nr:unnamed protein product [Adineta steineri]CAF4280970.1 unnamed protein product [Adineta steineri]
MSYKRLRLDQRYEIIFLSEHKYGPQFGNKKTAGLIKCDPKTVRYWRARWKETKDLTDGPRSGRPRVTTEEENEMILNEIEEYDHPSSASIVNNLKRKKVNVSAPTVRRILNKGGYKFAAPLSKPLLTLKHKQKRLEWAKLMKNQDWDKIIFSDECTINLGPVKRRQWQREGDRKIFRTVKYPGKVHVWGCFARHGYGQILCFKENLTSIFLCEQDYAKTFRHSTRQLFGRDDHFKLLEDNDPKHRSNMSKKEKINNGIECLPWPSCSPDANPIENLWNILKIRVAMKNPGNIGCLIRTIKEEWTKLPPEFCNNLVESMEDRLDAIILGEGDYIMY